MDDGRNVFDTNLRQLGIAMYQFKSKRTRFADDESSDDESDSSVDEAHSSEEASDDDDDEDEDDDEQEQMKVEQPEHFR